MESGVIVINIVPIKDINYLKQVSEGKSYFSFMIGCDCSDPIKSFKVNNFGWGINVPYPGTICFLDLDDIKISYIGEGEIIEVLIVY